MVGDPGGVGRGVVGHEEVEEDKDLWGGSVVRFGCRPRGEGKGGAKEVDCWGAYEILEAA